MQEDEMGEQHISAEAQVAAKWWADQLRGIPKLDNGDDSPTGSMVAAMAVLAHERTPAPPDDSIARFEELLANDVQRRLDAGRSVVLDCDYGPGYELSNIATEAGVRAGITSFPWKTTMWIRRGSVSVSSGYGAPAVHLPLGTETAR